MMNLFLDEIRDDMKEHPHLGEAESERLIKE